MIGLDDLRKLYGAVREHRRVEERVMAILAGLIEPQYLRSGPGRTGIFRYAQRNFFSSLFLSIYSAVGIPAERRLFYGVINHCLRGIVTGTDNLLDDEYKELLPLNFPAPATRFKSVMHILLFDRILFRIVAEGVREGLVPAPAADRLQQALFDALVPIGAEEAGEEGGVATILSPEAVLDSVHMYKGGKLLCLAFVAPLQLEDEHRWQLQKAEEGIYHIGLGLQMIDDLTDFDADIADRRHNYLLSVIHHEGSAGEREALARRLAERRAGGEAVEERYRQSAALVVERAIDEALLGFALLREAGYWLDQTAAFTLIRYLFRLRGVRHLLALLPDDYGPGRRRAGEEGG